MLRLNDDKDLVDTLKRLIKENGGYCPCAVEKNEDTKCMCKEFREADSGMCHCGLFVRD